MQTKKENTPEILPAVRMTPCNGVGLYNLPDCHSDGRKNLGGESILKLNSYD
jgi:hypothetical protein